MWRNNKGVSIEGWRRGAGQRTRAARVNTDFVPAAARCYRDADLDRDLPITHAQASTCRTVLMNEGRRQDTTR